jgi:hypothetical protein
VDDPPVESADTSLTPLVRKRVARHIERCEVCSERRRALVSPLALLAALPLVPAPAGLRARVLGAVALVATSRRAADSGPWRCSRR